VVEIEVPPMKFLMSDGLGAPEGPDYAASLAALYPLAYTLKFALKKERGEGRCAQMLHVGPYADEGPTIERVHGFIERQGGRLRGKHHEIYLGDPRRTAPEKLKTVIRQPFE
jgi:hypothetical protein